MTGNTFSKNIYMLCTSCKPTTYVSGSVNLPFGPLRRSSFLLLKIAIQLTISDT